MTQPTQQQSAEPTLKPPRVQATCNFGHVIRTRQPPGTQLPCTRCNVENGRTTMVVVPEGVGNRPTVAPPSLPPTPTGLAVIARKKTTGTVSCSGCHAMTQLSSPPQPGEPAGWLSLTVGVPDAPSGRHGELLARACSAECVALILPAVAERLAQLPVAVADRPPGARSISALMRERPGR